MTSRLNSFGKTLRGLGPLFHLCVTIPTLIALVYFGLLASDVYISESSFIVRSPNKPESSGFGVLLKTVGFSNSGDEIYAANDYLASREALRALNRNGAVALSYGSHQVSMFDRFDPLGYRGSFETLYRYVGKKIAVQYDSSTAITTLTVRAFNAQDARRFNEQLLELAETQVNTLNDRARTDLVAVAQREVDRSRAEARQFAVALAAYRDKAGLVDPEKQAGAQVQMVSKMQDELIAAQIQLRQVQEMAPRSSEIEPLQARVAGLQQAIGAQTQRAAGGNGSLSSAAAEYQRRAFDEQFGEKQLAAALGALEEARLDSQHKQAYVERIVTPAVPDEAIEPNRLRGVLATFVMGLIVWGIASMMLASLRDHVE
ncbi:hypothetical protein [Novosphingobium sp.]|uniref:hypothetical protein n=1 Tax=Novosphingobium sp. TaxID=1874826 RepID=UPI003D0EBF16